jgi:hypothetical protein
MHADSPVTITYNPYDQAAITHPAVEHHTSRRRASQCNTAASGRVHPRQPGVRWQASSVSRQPRLGKHVRDGPIYWAESCATGSGKRVMESDGKGLVTRSQGVRLCRLGLGTRLWIHSLVVVGSMRELSRVGRIAAGQAVMAAYPMQSVVFSPMHWGAMPGWLHRRSRLHLSALQFMPL